MSPITDDDSNERNNNGNSNNNSNNNGNTDHDNKINKNHLKYLFLCFAQRQVNFSRHQNMPKTKQLTS